MESKLAPPKKDDGIEWTAQTLAQLGKITDTDIAKQLGVPVANVRLKRLALGLPAAKRESHQRIKWTPEMDALLGTDFDFAIARKLRMSVTSVASRRKQLKIASWKESKTP